MMVRICHVRHGRSVRPVRTKSHAEELGGATHGSDPRRDLAFDTTSGLVMTAGWSGFFRPKPRKAAAAGDTAERRIELCRYLGGGTAVR